LLLIERLNAYSVSCGYKVLFAVNYILGTLFVFRSNFMHTVSELFCLILQTKTTDEISVDAPNLELFLFH